MAEFRKVFLTVGFSLLFIYLQLQFELKSSPVPRDLERRAKVRYETLPQPSQVVEALLTVPPIIQLPPGWSAAYATLPGCGHSAPILTLPKPIR